jgi:hypothetical protein
VQRHLADLVQEERAAVGHAERAVVRRDRAGERAALPAEELGLDEVVGEVRARERDEGAASPRAARVDGLRDQALARAGLARHEHGRVARRCHVDDGAHLGEGGRVADEHDAVRVAPLPVGLASLDALELEHLDAAVDGDEERLELERLAEVVEGAGADRGHGVLELGERRHEDDLQRRAAREQAGAERVAAPVGELLVEEHHVDVARRREREGLVQASRRERGEPARGERVAQAAAQERVVVDDQHGARAAGVGRALARDGPIRAHAPRPREDGA